MHPGLLSPYRRRTSSIHRMPPTLKTVVALLTVVAIVLLPRFAWAAYGAFGCALLGAAIASRLPVRYFLGRLLVLEPLILAVASLSLLQPGGARVLAAMVVKSTTCVFTMVLLVAATPFSEVLRSLDRLRVPRLLVTTLALMYRYLFLLADEAARLRRARRCRTFLASRRRAWRGTATIVAQLFVLTSDRAQRVYSAMCARGWTP